MPITNVVPNVVSALLRRDFEAQNVWAGVGLDVSAEIETQGKSIDLGQITTTISVGDYVKGTDIEFQTLTDAKERLVVDKSKYFGVEVDDIDQVQSRPDIVEEGSRKSAIALARQVDSDAKAAWIASIPDDKKMDGTKVSTAAMRTATAGKSLMAEINELALMATLDKWPLSGRYLIMVPHAAAAIRRHVLENNPGDGTLANDTFINGATRGNLLGFGVREDINATYDGSADTPIMYAVHVEGMYYANQIESVENIRKEKGFADIIKGLWVYGYKRTDPFIYMLKNATT